MEDNLRRLYDSLVKDNYELPEYDIFANDMKAENNLKRLYDNISVEYELPEYGTFVDDMGLKKKGNTFQDYFVSGQKDIPFLGLSGLRPKASVSSSEAPPPLSSEGKEVAEVEAPAPPKVDLNETFAKEQTLTSVMQSQQKIPEYLEAKTNELADVAIKEVQDAVDKMHEAYQKKIEANPESFDKLKAQFEKEKEKLIQDRTGKLQTDAESLIGKGREYEYLDNKYQSAIDKEVRGIVSKGIPYANKKKALEDLQNTILSQVSSLPDEDIAQLKAEIGDAIARSALLNEQGLPTIYGWKREVESKKQNIDRVANDMLSKRPDLRDAEALVALNPAIAQDKGVSEYLNLRKASKAFDNILNLPDDGGGFFGGLKSQWRAMSSMGLSAHFDQLDQYAISLKQVGGKELTEGEQALLDAKGIHDMAASSDEINKGYQYGSMIGHSVAWMENFALTGGFGGVGAKVALKALVGKVKNKFLQNVVKGAGQATTRTPFLVGGYTDAARRLTGAPALSEDGTWEIDESAIEPVWKAIAKGTYTNWSEAFSETLGGWGKGTGVGKKITQTLGLDKVAIPPGIRNFFKSVGFEGIGELPEEYFASLIQTPVLGDQTLKEAFSAENVWDTAVVTGIMVGAMGSAALPSVTANNIKRANNKQLIDIFGKDNIVAIRDAIMNNDNKAFAGALQNAFAGKSYADLEGMSLEKAQKRLVEYAHSIGQQRGAEVAQEEIGKAVEGEPAKEQITKTEEETTDAGREEAEDVTHVDNIKNKFREVFGRQGIPAEQIDGTIALMDARANVWANEEKGRTPGQWYDKIADIKEGEFQEDTPKLYQLPDGRQVMGMNMPEVVNGFYSPIEKRLGEFKQERASVNKWKEIIGKGDEATFTGVREWLDGMKPDQSLTKAEINQFMQGNRIEVVEVVKAETAGTPKTYEELPSRIQDAMDKYTDGVIEDNELRDIIEGEGYNLDFALDGMPENIYKKGEQPPKHAQYQLPGEKENYKEVLVTMPANELTLEEKFQRIGYTIEQSDYGAWRVMDDMGIPIHEKDTREELLSTFPERRVPMVSSADKNFTRSHWDEPNVLVHLRMNTRTDADGKKVLFLEEVQSDWGQIGKKEGFEGEKLKEAEKVVKESGIDYKVKADGLIHYYDKEGDEIPFNNVPENIRKYIGQIVNDAKGIPTAPFVTDTNAWVKLGLKTALREAVNQGVDRIAWSTGTQQFERWGSEKVDWVKNKTTTLSSQKRLKELGDKIINYSETSQEREEYDELSKEGGWTVSVKEQFRGNAFDGMDVDKEALSESGIRINSKEQLKELIKRTMSRERNESALNKLTDRIWDRMQTEDKGTSLPRKEGMESFYGIPAESKLGIVGNIAKSLFKQEPKMTEIRSENRQLNAFDNPEEIKKFGTEIKTQQEANKLLDNKEKVFFVNSKGQTWQLYDKKDIQEAYDTKTDKDRLVTVRGTQQHSIDITPQLKAEVEEGLPLFQKDKGVAKGAVEILADGKVVIHALPGADISTVVHEIWHVFEKDLAVEEKAVFEKWSGKKQGTREFSEAFARAGERYLRDGKAPNEQLKAIFEKFKNWLTEIYRTIKGTPLEKKLSPEVRQVFDRLLGATEQKVSPPKPLVAPVQETQDITGREQVEEVEQAPREEPQRLTEKHPNLAFLEQDLPSKKPNKSDLVELDDFEGGEIAVKPIVQKIKTKTEDDALSNIVSKDKDRPVMNGVLYDADNQAKVATDGAMLVVIPTKVTGKTRVINPKTKEVVDGRFPNYQAVTPENTNIIDDVNADELLSEVGGVSRANDFVRQGWNQESAIKAKVLYGDNEIYFNPSNIKRGLSALMETGTTDIILEMPDNNTRAMVVRDKNNPKKYALVMPMLGEEGGTKFKTILDKRVTEKVEETAPPKPKSEQLKEKEVEIKNRLANNIEGLMGAIGGIKEFSGEQRASVLKYLSNILKDLGELTLLKGEQLHERLKEYLKENKITLPDDIVQEAVDKYEGKAPESPLPTAVEALSPESGAEVSPKVESVSKERAESEKTKIRGAQRNALLRDETEQQKTIGEIVKKNQERYTVLHGGVAIERAKALIDELGFEGATIELEEKTRNIDDYPIRQVARQILLDAYSRVLGDPMATEVDKQKSYTAVDRLQVAIAREGTPTGQGNAMLQIWTSMQPSGLLQYVIRKNQKFNEKKLSDKRGGDTTIANDLKALYDKLDNASKKIVDDVLNGKDVSDRLSRAKERKEPAILKSVPREKIKQERDYRKQLLDDYRKKAKTTSVSAVGMSSEQIELAGNLMASYVRSGYWKVVDVIDNLKRDLKSVGVRLNDEQVGTILSMKKDGKETYRSWLRKKEADDFLRRNMTDTGSRIKDVAKKHWSERDELGRTLAQKFVDEVGLEAKEAQEIEAIILKEYQEKVKKAAESELIKTLGTSKIPTKGKNKTLMDRLFEMLNLGALDTDMYAQLFAEKFGLVSDLQQEQMSEILRLANIVQQTTDMGWINRDATIDLTKYIYELYPQERVREVFDTWIGLAYANMLMGLSTSVLNLWSAGSNMAFRPVRDVTNLTKWYNEIRKGKNADFYNPFGEMVYAPALRGMIYGGKEATEIYRNGDLNNKYVEQVTKKSKFYVTPLERDKYGKAKRFKPFKVKIAGKTLDFNIFNLYKYAARNLSAQDKMMLNTAYDMEIASILRDVLREQTGLKGGALTRKVMEVYKGVHLNWAELQEQVEREAETYRILSGKTMTDLQKKIRLKELERNALPLTSEQKKEAEQLARSNIFTDDRGGFVATAAQWIGRASNSHPLLGMAIKPYVPFTKIVGNVTEYMLDHTPFYGFMRANGYGIASTAKRLFDPTLMTAQMGKAGSKAYYEQMGRAWLGTVAFTVVAALFLGSDDEDFIEISGGYTEEGMAGKVGRENVLPRYTLRIGNVKIPYLNIPGLAIPLGLIGNLNDRLRAGVPEDELIDRFTAAMLLDAFLDTLTMTRDMSILEGTQNLFKMIADVASMDSGAWSRTWKQMVRSYVGFAARPLPQNNNLVLQITKAFDPTSYSSKDLKSMLAYAGGIQRFVNFPNIDQLGNEMRTYPGETLLPYTHWMNIKGKDEMWAFLAANNAIPRKAYNTPIHVETEDGLHKRALEENELYEYTKLAGEYFATDLRTYLSDKENVKLRVKEKVVIKNSKGEEEEITGTQDDVANMVSEARADARTALFNWGLVKEDMPGLWKVIEANKAYMPYRSAKKIGEHDLNKDELYRYNSIATTFYAPMAVEYINSEVAKYDKQDIDELTGKSYYEIELNNIWQDALSEAESQMEDWLEAKKD